MDMRHKTFKMKAYLELKDGSFEETATLLQRPDLWKDLKGADRRLIKRLAAHLAVAGFELK